MPSNTALSSAPILTSIPTDDELFLDAEGVDVDSNTSAGFGVAAGADADGMPPLPELPRQVIIAKRSHSDIRKSGPSKSWVWAYFKNADGAQKNCLYTLCNQEVSYSSTRSTGALAWHFKRYHLSMWQEHLHKKLRFPSLQAWIVPAHCPLKVL
jgi:hypothetical protein